VTTPYGTFVPCGYRNVITVCDMTPLLFPGSHGRMNVWHHRFVLPVILRRADRVITISDCSKRDIVRLCGIPEEKVVVTPLAADPAFRPDPEGTAGSAVTGLPRPYILNVGTLEPRKNLEGLLRAFGAAKREGLPHTLVVTGARGWGRSRLAAIVEELRLEESVVFTGFVDDHDLPHLYAGADFFVYPSLYEGFGLPPLEAMACGTPVITSNVSSLPEVTGEAALLVDPRSVTDLAAAMVRLAGDASLRETLRERGLARARLFSWERTAAETLTVYRGVLGKG
jgi:glycosyltransferase involved in cell wall biosynthesis